MTRSLARHYDGLGRQLHEGSTVFGLDRSPGLLWELVDTTAALVVFSLVCALYKLEEWLRRRGMGHRPAR